MLHLLAYTRRLEVEGVTYDPSELFECYRWVKSEMDLDDIEEERARPEEELDDAANQFRLVSVEGEGNQMSA